VDSTALLATNAVGAVFWLLVWIVVFVLTLVAWVRIITKAGYSGWWIAVPLSAVALQFLSLILGVGSLTGLIHSPLGFNRAEFDVAGVLAKLAFAVYVVSWILFLVFGFSDWPALSGPRPRVPTYGGDQGTPVPGAPAPISLPPPRAQGPGWYQVGATNNDQGYWDGRGWTSRRRWEGAGWTDVPVGPPDPGL
jgi:hypothetical protein